MATHYGTAIVPTRVRKPRDKAKVEVAVQLVQRWVLARLRHRRFFSLAELNSAIGELIETLNNRPMRHLGSSRRALFETTAIRLCRMASLPRGHRLPRRGVWTLVFRALPADARHYDRSDEDRCPSATARRVH